MFTFEKATMIEFPENIVFIIVEDDAGHALLTKKTLRRLGLEHEIRHFYNGYEFLNFLTEHNTKTINITNEAYVVLMDISMPGLSGIEVLCALKAENAWKNIPVVMVSTSDSSEEVNSCFELGCFDFLVKHVDIKKLAGTLSRLSISHRSIVQIKLRKA
jgi:CheY-like chemotaxis protein